MTTLEITMLPLHLLGGTGRARSLAGATALCLLAFGCALPPPLMQDGPSDASVANGAVRYAPVLADYRSQRPAEPAPWRERNDRVAPAPKR